MPISASKFIDQAKPRRFDEIPERKYFYIFTNGEVTETEYFGRFKSKLPKGMIRLDIDFKNNSPGILVRKSLRTAALSGINYDEIWIVFDKDDFACFEDAVKNCKSEQNCYAGFSNECFELWLILHFEEVNSGIDRDKLSNKLKDLVNRYSRLSYLHNDELKSRTNITAVLNIVEENGNRNDAIKRARELQSNLSDNEFCLNNPSTSIYKLVEKLEEYIIND